MTNHQGDESTLILDFDIANSAQTEYCSTFHFPSVPPWPLGPLGPMDHVDNLDILHHLDHSDRSNHFDNPDWSMIDQEDNCRIRIVYLVLLFELCMSVTLCLPWDCLPVGNFKKTHHQKCLPHYPSYIEFSSIQSTNSEGNNTIALNQIKQI